MKNIPDSVVEYFFGRTVKPGETSTIALMFRELAITNVAVTSVCKKECTVKGIIEGQEFIIATLSPKRPQQHVDLKFNKDCLFVSFEVIGDCEVDICGYVTGLDGTKLMSLKQALELSDASDDEDYVEEGEKENDKEEEEESNDDDDKEEEESDSCEEMLVREEEKMMKESEDHADKGEKEEEDMEEESDDDDDSEEEEESDSCEEMLVREEEKMMKESEENADNGKEEEEDGKEEEEDDDDSEEEDGEDGDEEEEEEKVEEEKRDAINFNQPNYKHLGKFVKYKDIQVGKGGLPINGHRVQINYRLTLPTGEILDSDNIEHSTRLPFPTDFRVGLGHVVRGMDRAILGMRVGSTRQILIAPEQGFGVKGNIVSDIRPGEAFMVEVTLLGCK